MSDSKTYEGLTSLVFLIGLYEGVLPFVGKLLHWHPLLSMPLRLSAPAWWIVSAAVIVVAIALLEVIDRAKTRAGEPNTVAGAGPVSE